MADELVTGKIAIIAGTGFYSFPEIVGQRTIRVETSFGQTVDIVTGKLNGRDVLFLPRHGEKHHVPPHKINYRANIAALAAAGAEKIIAINAVGGIAASLSPGKLVVPHQVIDYTHGRDHTFFDCFDRTPDPVGNCHIDFSDPFSPKLRRVLIGALQSAGQDFAEQGVYACTQGPRLETTAEVQRLKSDGCDIVGMTLMPEASLAREKGLEYASICLVVNWAAGVESNRAIDVEEMKRVLQRSAVGIRALIADSAGALY